MPRATQSLFLKTSGSSIQLPTAMGEKDNIGNITLIFFLYVRTLSMPEPFLRSKVTNEKCLDFFLPSVHRTMGQA